jgi:putative FmdB family regulatory protein
MPIYEFYCEKCNTVFNFFSRVVNTTKTPNCPQCRKALKRQMSLFAKVSRGKEASKVMKMMAMKNQSKSQANHRCG